METKGGIDMIETELLDTILTIQRMEERGIFVKDHDICDAVELVKFNRMVDAELMMNKKVNNKD